MIGPMLMLGLGIKQESENYLIHFHSEEENIKLLRLVSQDFCMALDSIWIKNNDSNQRKYLLNAWLQFKANPLRTGSDNTPSFTYIGKKKKKGYFK